MRFSVTRLRYSSSRERDAHDTRSPTRAQTASRCAYSVAVVFTASAHIAFLAYVPSGGFLALRWQRTILLHVPCVVWGLGVVWLKLPCPLTWLETFARAHAGMDPLPTTGFIGRYVEGVFVPTGRTGAAQSLAFYAAVLSWLLFAARRRQPPAS